MAEIAMRYLIVILLVLVTTSGWASASSESVGAGGKHIQDRVAQLIEKLGDDEYRVREQAQEELARIGFAAYDQLLAATKHEDLEIASRARYLVRLIRYEWTRADDPEPVRELLEDYEFQDFGQKAVRIEKLAYLPDGMGVPALCRVVRFEQSELLAKYAATRLINREPPGEVARAEWLKSLREHLGQGNTTAARWLLTYVRLREKPEAALAEWRELVAAEHEVMERTPNLSSPSIVAALVYRQAAAEAALGRRDEAERTAEKARTLYPADRELQQQAHLETAMALQRQGWFAWAAAEYELVSESGWSKYAFSARSRYAEMLHDQGQHLKGAEVLKKLLQPEDARLRRIIDSARESLRPLHARMNYFHACHWKDQGNTEEYRQYLDKALEADPNELDTLIACYQLPDQTPEYRDKIVAAVRRATEALQKEVEAAESPMDQASAYNQYAWLVGNTEGDTDLALKYAHRAVELVPDSGAYLDTLAHVYYGRGDYAKAVEYQEQAAQADPHSGLIRSKLELFRKTLEAQQQEQEKKEP